ncbi:MAG: UDP-N-acetylglucosamine 2-epimerase (non-hydrolyzing), partial [Candidatus Omnitrophota bacterium]
VSRAIKEWTSGYPNKAIKEVILHTGQHYDKNMSEVFFKELDIPRPKYNLSIGSGAHCAQIALMLSGIERVLLREEPDMVLVYGDTNSTLAGALAAKKLGLLLAHIEAGLRSFNMAMPEEVNRIVTDRISDLLFCPSKISIDNLRREGITSGVHLTGDVMYDSIMFYREKAEKKSSVLKRLVLSDKRYVLATIHRAENTDRALRLQGIFSALETISSDIEVVVPLHPRTVKMLKKNRGSIRAGSLKIIDPVSYLDMIMLERHAAVIMTDSGGVQKEAYFNRVPCITLRDETEWVETSSGGRNVIVGAVKEPILKAYEKVKKNRTVDYDENIYGDGKASRRIVKLIACRGREK